MVALLTTIETGVYFMQRFKECKPLPFVGSGKLDTVELKVFLNIVHYRAISMNVIQ